MSAIKLKLVEVLEKIPQYIPDWSSPIWRCFSGMYSEACSRLYSSIKEEKLVKTPMGPYIYVDYSDPVERSIAYGNWEREYMEMFCRSVKRGDVVVDVGAYIGIFSLLASERIGEGGCIYSFKPVPRNHERLLRNMKINQAKNIKVYEKGLFDKRESRPIHILENYPAESTIY